MPKPTVDHKEIRLWAEKNGVTAAEELPSIVDHIPATLRLVPAEYAAKHIEIVLISWEDFFTKFDELGLAVVFDATRPCCEILQIEGKDPSVSSVYRELLQKVDPKESSA